MKRIFLILIVFGIAESQPDTRGCIVGSNRQQQSKQKFSGLTFQMNTLSLVFCTNFNAGDCETDLYEADEDGFYIAGHYPCKYFTGDANNEGKSVISFFSKVVDDNGVVRFYPQETDKSGLFLTKTFKTVVSTGATEDDLADQVEAVVPRHLGQAEDYTAPTFACFNTAVDEQLNEVSTELTEGETLAEKTGKVHCTFTALCDNLKRTCIDDHLVVRTTTADLSESDADGADVIVNNDFYFLTRGQTGTEITCGNDGGDTLTYEWFNNGGKISGEVGQIYSYDHSEDKDTILQCQIWETTTTEGGEEVTRVTETYIWNVFTVEPAKVEADVSEEDIRVTHRQFTTFNCIPEDHPTFPSPWGLWYWLDDEENSEEKLEEVTKENDGQFSFRKNITYSYFGSFKCYLFNGIGDKVLAKDYKTVFVVETMVKHLTPIPKFWFEYNVLPSPPEVYYVTGDTVHLSCNVTKEADYDIWWKFGEEYYTLTIVDGTDVLKKLNPKSDTAESVTDSLIAVIRDGLSVTKYDDPESLGHQTKQDFIISEYTSTADNDAEEVILAICFLVNRTSTSTVGGLKGITEAQDDNESMLRNLSVRIFSHITKPVVKGPLNQIQSEKEAKDMVLNCKTDGVPPSFIYFMFTNNKTDGINITKEVLKKEVQFTRYTIDRKSDILTSLTIKKPTEQDEGKFTCFAINRGTKENEPVAGPDADVFIEERCSEGAQFCFKNTANSLDTSLRTKILFLLISLKCVME